MCKAQNTMERRRLVQVTSFGPSERAAHHDVKLHKITNYNQTDQKIFDRTHINIIRTVHLTETLLADICLLALRGGIYDVYCSPPPESDQSVGCVQLYVQLMLNKVAA